MEECVAALKDGLSDSVKRCIGDAREVAVLFSGGLDSSLLAHLAKTHAGNATITLYTVGTVVSHDMIKAKQAASILNLQLKPVVIKGGDIEFALPRVAHIIGSTHPVRLSFSLPLYLGMKSIDEDLVLSGQGADELFGGYSRYLRMGEDELETNLKGDVENLIHRDIAMDHAIAGHFHKVLATPFLDGEVVARAMLIPVRYKVKEGQRKIVLRQAATELGLSAELAQREKKAVQYSSGIVKELRHMAKRRGMEVNELMEHLLEKRKKN
jgi:asparagine synthase (glutamine-hydrolysing)